jgi:hypothetical protein
LEEGIRVAFQQEVLLIGKRGYRKRDMTLFQSIPFFDLIAILYIYISISPSPSPSLSLRQIVRFSPIASGYRQGTVRGTTS